MLQVAQPIRTGPDDYSYTPNPVGKEKLLLIFEFNPDFLFVFCFFSPSIGRHHVYDSCGWHLTPFLQYCDHSRDFFRTVWMEGIGLNGMGREGNALLLLFGEINETEKETKQ